jgi:uracil-DNA glycosylase
MIAAQALSARHAVTLSAPEAYDEWRAAARALLAQKILPEAIVWQVDGEEAPELFAADPFVPSAATPPELRVSRAFMQVAGKAALHSFPARHDLLYRMLWRLQSRPRLMEDSADADVRRLHDLARQVRRDIHKMRAFVRFREIADEDGVAHYIAWFEPQFHILRANAKFFVERFANMRWSILTPIGSLHWDGITLHHGPPARREDAPAEDATEDLWTRYYASIFNPARLKVKAMLKEMPN